MNERDRQAAISACDIAVHLLVSLPMTLMLYNTFHKTVQCVCYKTCVITVEEGYVSQSYTLSLMASLIIDAAVSAIRFLSFDGSVHFLLYHFSCKMAWATSLKHTN